MNFIDQFENFKKEINIAMAKLTPEKRAEIQDEADKLIKTISESQQQILNELKK